MSLFILYRYVQPIDISSSENNNMQPAVHSYQNYTENCPIILIYILCPPLSATAIPMHAFLTVLSYFNSLMEYFVLFGFYFLIDCPFSLQIIKPYLKINGICLLHGKRFEINEP